MAGPPPEGKPQPLRCHPATGVARWGWGVLRKLRSHTAIATKRALVVCSVEEEPDLVWVLHGKVLDDYGEPDMAVFRTKKTWINEVPADGKTTPVERDGLAFELLLASFAYTISAVSIYTNASVLLSRTVLHLLTMLTFNTVHANGGTTRKGGSYTTTANIERLDDERKKAHDKTKDWFILLGSIVIFVGILTLAVFLAVTLTSSGANSAFEDTTGDSPVYVIPMTPEESPSGRRGLSHCRSGDTNCQNTHSGFTWTKTCPRSAMKCMDTRGDWVDLSKFYEFSFLVGFGYDRLFGDCDGYQPFVSPYALSHAGGLFMDQYEHLQPYMRSEIDAFARGINVDSFDDVKHSGAYAATCGKGGYLADPHHYTCGLQYITMGATFPGEHCKKLRLTNESSKLKAGPSGEYEFLFNQTAGLSGAYSEITRECAWNPGKLPLFDGIRKIDSSRTKSAFLTFAVALTLYETQPANTDFGQYYPSLDQFKFLSKNSELTTNCQMDIAIAIGKPSCNGNGLSAVKVEKFENEQSSKDVSKYTGLTKYGFAYNASNNLWHRQGVKGCGEGCCDECFQWYCPLPSTGRTGAAKKPFQCRPYTYDCRPGQEQEFANSSQMACGVTPNFVEEGKSRQRC